jgi:hypothetical protein
VGLEVGPLVEGLVAQVALVRRLVHVEHLVNGEGARLAEALAAVFALERLLSAVDVPGTHNKNIQSCKIEFKKIRLTTPGSPIIGQCP